TQKPPSTAHDPAVDDPESGEHAEDQPPGPPPRRGVLRREVVLAVRAALAVLMNLPAAVGARDGRLVVLVLELVVEIGVPGHDLAPKLRTLLALRAQDHRFHISFGRLGRPANTP